MLTLPSFAALHLFCLRQQTESALEVPKTGGCTSGWAAGARARGLHATTTYITNGHRASPRERRGNAVFGVEIGTENQQRVASDTTRSLSDTLDTSISADP